MVSLILYQVNKAYKLTILFFIINASPCKYNFRHKKFLHESVYDEHSP